MRRRMEKKVDTTIQFSGLKTGTYEYRYSLDGDFFSRFENDDLRECRVECDVKLKRDERLMVFELRFEGSAVMECDRCLGKMEVPLSGEGRLFVKFGESGGEDDEDVVMLPEGERKIDLGQWMYELVAVEVPIVHVHADDEEGNCTCEPEMLRYLEGEGAEKEKEEGLDPRWEALKRLKDEK